MSRIFEALPGLEVPVGSISSGLERMWEGAASEGRPSPAGEQSMATQVNLVLHLGFNTDAADAVAQFDTAVKFSRRHPSRVVVLCPLYEDAGVTTMRAKVYGECSVGKSADDTRCCEFVMLSYPRSARVYLESQVSICLSTDLPLYYWAHRFSESAKLADYRYLLGTARRILLDSATAPDDAFSYAWPHPENVRDLALARLLPVRQSIGQFLGRYPVAALGSGLRAITLGHGAGVGSEARALLSWIRQRIGACGATSEAVEISQPADMAPRAFLLRFAYGDKRSFQWKADVATAHACFDADFGAGRTVMPASVALLSPEGALGEAMFF
jgi:glucose-6-phosphate dehydrogenase assembly protein OpcA